MTEKRVGLLGSAKFFEGYGARVEAQADVAGVVIEQIIAPSTHGHPWPEARLAQIDAAFFSRDIWEGSTMSVPSPASSAFFEVADAAGALRWLHVTSAGTDLSPYRTSLTRGITISTSSGSNAEPIAQTVVAAVLAQSRGFPRWLNAQHRRTWCPHRGDDVPRDLRDQTALIVGLGPIGLEIARLLHAVGLRTVGVRRSSAAAPNFDEVYSQADFSTLLPHCDWLVLCCPLTDETRLLMDHHRISLLAPHARIANVGRGELVDESALVSALREGRLAGAYLDVFQHEPLPPDSPFWSLPNVWISPHNSASSRGNEARTAEIFLQNLELWLNERTLINQHR